MKLGPDIVAFKTIYHVWTNCWILGVVSSISLRCTYCT